MAGGRPRKYSIEDLQEIGKRLIEWCKQDDNWHVSKFEYENGFASDFCRNMSIDRKEEFAAVYIQAKEILGNKLVKKALDENTDKWLIKTLIPHYLRDIKRYIHEEKQVDADIKEKAKSKYEQKENCELFDKLDAYIDSKTKDKQDKS